MDYKSLFLENILDNLDVGICIYDDKGAFLFINSAAMQGSGRTRSDYTNRTVYDLYRDGILNKCIVDEVYKTKKTITTLQTSISVDGKKRERLVTVSPIFDSNGKVVNAVSELREMQRLNNAYEEAKRLNQNNLISHKKNIPHSIVCESQSMKTILETARTIADIDSSILLFGESGTGKDVIAHYVHNYSKRREHEMVEINCASLPESLLEAELFGYEKGAFTGASSTGKVGLVESSDKSTLFLDEINSLPLNLQGKLLRMLETKKIKRIGSLKSKEVDFRLIAATNQDLLKCVKEGTFRGDLYYRLNVIPIQIPPLKERKADIKALIDHYLKFYCDRYQTEKVFSKTIYDILLRYDWPGNVRELKNFVERMVVMSSPSVVKINQIPEGMLEKDFDFTAADANDAERKKNFEENEKQMIIKALNKNYGHREKTAQYLNISRRTLQYKLKKYNLLK